MRMNRDSLEKIIVQEKVDKGAQVVRASKGDHKRTTSLLTEEGEGSQWIAQQIKWGHEAQ